MAWQEKCFGQMAYWGPRELLISTRPFIQFHKATWENLYLLCCITHLSLTHSLSLLFSSPSIFHCALWSRSQSEACEATIWLLVSDSQLNALCLKVGQRLCLILPMWLTLEHLARQSKPLLLNTQPKLVVNDHNDSNHHSRNTKIQPIFFSQMCIKNKAKNYKAI